MPPPATRGGPRAHRPVVGVPGDPVGAEGHDRVRPDLVDDRGDAVGARCAAGPGARPVLVAEPAVLGDAQEGQGLVELAGPQGAEAVGGPALGVVGAVLAAGGGDDDDAVAPLASRQHEPGGQEGLVVGVGPDAEQGAGHDSTSTTIIDRDGGQDGQGGVAEPPRDDRGDAEREVHRAGHHQGRRALVADEGGDHQRGERGRGQVGQPAAQRRRAGGARGRG